MRASQLSWREGDTIVYLRRITRMKKLLIFTLGLGIVLGTVSFAQDTTGTDKKMEKKGKKKKTDDTDKK
jgi:hypothetical protein